MSRIKNPYTEYLNVSGGKPVDSVPHVDGDVVRSLDNTKVNIENDPKSFERMISFVLNAL